MKAIRHLLRLWRALSGRLDIEAALITTDDLDAGMLPEPVLRALNGTNGQDVDDGALFRQHQSSMLTTRKEALAS